MAEGNKAVGYYSEYFGLYDQCRYHPDSVNVAFNMADDIDAFNPFEDENRDAPDEENTARAVLPDVS